MDVDSEANINVREEVGKCVQLFDFFFNLRVFIAHTY